MFSGVGAALVLWLGCTTCEQRVGGSNPVRGVGGIGKSTRPQCSCAASVSNP